MPRKHNSLSSCPIYEIVVVIDRYDREIGSRLKISRIILLIPPLPVSQLYVEKQKGESLGVVIVESGWGSILPTVILANMLNSGPAARSGKLSVGDQIMSINDTSLVGLPLATCQGIIKV